MPIDASAAQQALTYFDSWLAFRQRYLRIPGVQAAVYLGDGIALTVSYGHADLAQQTVLTAQHLFRIASHSKTFTSTAVFRLVERGVLRLDDTAGAWVPELATSDSPVGQVTVRELLSHAGGIYRDSCDGDFWQLRQPFPGRDALLRIVSSGEASVLPRNDRFKYSNIGYGLLGLVLEAAGGCPYDELLQREVLDPLELHDTGPEFDAQRAAQYATGYSGLDYAPARVPIEHVDTGALAAATGFYSTATDLVRYFSAHFFGDSRLLSDDSKRLMQQSQWEVKEGAKHYAYGLAVTKVGDRTLIGHGGGYPGHITNSVADPVDRLAISVFTNAIDGPAESLAHAAVRLLDRANADPDPSVDSGSLERFTGRFANLWGVVDVAVLGGRLYLIDPTQDNPVEDIVELAVHDESAVKIVKSSGYGSYGESLSYEFDAAGQVLSVRGPSATTLTPIERFSLPEVVRAPR